MASSNVPLPYPTNSVILLFIFCLVAYITLLPPHKRGLLLGKRYTMPPGPRGRPIIGCLLQWLQVRKRGIMIPWVSYNN